jgi:hypothetical protein
MRSLVLLVAALGVSGCCIADALAFPEACVQELSGRCVDLVRDTCSDDPSPPSPECGASVREGTCSQLGYTKPCGDHAVRPDSSC